ASHESMWPMISSSAHHGAGLPFFGPLRVNVAIFASRSTSYVVNSYGFFPVPSVLTSCSFVRDGSVAMVVVRRCTPRGGCSAPRGGGLDHLAHLANSARPAVQAPSGAAKTRTSSGDTDIECMSPSVESSLLPIQAS